MTDDIQEIIKRYKKANPEYCQSLGIQESYGKVTSFRQEDIDKRIKEIKVDIKVIDSRLEKNDFKDYTKIELQALRHSLDYELFEWEENQEYKKNPLICLSALVSIQGVYIARNYAPLTERIRHIIDTEKAVPGLIKQALSLLEPNLSRAKLEVAFMVAQPVISYLKDELIEEILKVNDKKLIEEWSQVNVETIEHLEKYLNTLKTDYYPKSVEKFALGEKKYLKMLEKSEGITISSEKLLKVAMKDLEKNHSAMQEILSEIGIEKFNKLKEDYPKVEKLLETAQKAVKQSKEFIIEKNLVTLPEGVECTVVETPGYMRATTFAAMNPTNIAEDSKATESYYYITPPNKDWPEEERNNYMKTFNKGNLEAVTIHEVYPGHFLHFEHIKHLSPILRLFGFSITTIEGWAHYTEELVIEEGYNKIDQVEIQVGQILSALVRNCRFVASVRMHCQDMTVEDAKKLFMEKGMMTERAAEMEARRGTIDPMYLNYTLGKLIIQKLRDNYKKEQGNNFSLKKFHDTFLSYGGVNLMLIRENMLKNSGGVEDIL